MSYSCFYCSGGEEIFWEKKMLLRVHFWSHTGLNGQDLQLLEQQVFQCPWCFLVGWELYSALPPVHTAANREALSSTMQTKARSRSAQHLPVAALLEHMDKVVVFLGRGSLSSATVSSGATLPTQHLPAWQPFLFTEHPQDCWASWARIITGLSMWGYCHSLGRSQPVMQSTQENQQQYFLPKWAVSGSSTAWVLRLWGRVLIYWVH